MNDSKIRVYVFQKKKIAHNCFFFAKVYLFIYFVAFFSFFFLFFSPYFCSYSSCSTYFFFWSISLITIIAPRKKKLRFFFLPFCLGIFLYTSHFFRQFSHFFTLFSAALPLSFLILPSHQQHPLRYSCSPFFFLFFFFTLANFLLQLPLQLFSFSASFRD